MLPPCVPGFTMNVSSWPNFLLRTLAEARFAPSDVFVDVSLCDIARGRARLRLLSLAFQRSRCQGYVHRITSGSRTPMTSKRYSQLNVFVQTPYLNFIGNFKK